MRKKNIVHKISKTFSQHNNKKYLAEKIFKKLQRNTKINDIPIGQVRSGFMYYLKNENEKGFFFLREQSE
jgi:hypothetical protein